MKKETEIVTDLRTINLKYENRADLSEFEIKLIEKYKNLHKEYFLFSKEIDEFEKQNIKTDLMVTNITKEYEIVKELFNELQTFNDKKVDENDKLSIEFIENKVKIYNLKNEETIKHINEVSNSYNEYEKEYKKLDDKQIELDNQVEEFFEDSYTFSQNYEKYEIEIMQFDDDEQEFYGEVDKINNKWYKISDHYSSIITDKFNPLVEGYQKLIDYVEKNKTITPITVKIPNESDVFPYIKDKKQYFIQPGNPKIAEYADKLTEAAKAGKGILLQIDFKAIERKDISKIVEIISISQHKKSWIENIIFKMHIQIINIPSTEPDSIHANLFSNNKVVAYFAELGKNPLIFFFMDQIDISMMSLSADKLINSELDVKKDLEGEDDEEEAMLIGYDNKQVQKLFDRFFTACTEFQKYCDETGVDTRPYIEEAINGVRNGFNFDEKIKTFTYNDVVEHYEKIKSLPLPLISN